MRFLLFCLGLLFYAGVAGQDSVTIAAGTNDLNRYNLFLKGEYHEYQEENERSFLLLAKHLYSHNNVRYLVFEWGPDFSFLANRYMQTQDVALLFKNTLSFSKAFWDTLALHNRPKSDADKIKIAGFDFNRSVFTARAFRELTKGKPAFEDTAIQTAIENIIRWDEIKWTWDGQKVFVQQMKNLRGLCKTRAAELAAYFGQDWPSFFAIINHDVESTPQVRRDKESIVYVKEFLEKKGNGNVLFNLGVNHTYFDHAGMGYLLQKDKVFQGGVCSIYPYHRTSNAEKEKYQQEQDENLPTLFLEELQTAADYSLINLEQKGIYPKEYRKSQWVFVIPKLKQR